MARIESFRDLDVYQQAVEQARMIYVLSCSFPKEETYSLTDQIRRSSRAVSALLAEGWARRRYRGAFINRVNQAQAEAMETQVWLEHALKCGYIAESVFRQLDDEWQHIGARLERVIQRADTFCRTDGAERL